MRAKEDSMLEHIGVIITVISINILDMWMNRDITMSWIGIICSINNHFVIWNFDLVILVFIWVIPICNHDAQVEGWHVASYFVAWFWPEYFVSIKVWNFSGWKNFVVTEGTSDL